MGKFATFLLAITVPAAVGCAGSSRFEDGVTRIAYIVKVMTDGFQIDMKGGAEKYAMTNGTELSSQSSEKEIDVERQIQMVESALVSRADVIILSAADSQTLIPAIIRVNEVGVPMILVNDTIEPGALETYGGHVVTYVGIDQYATTKLAGEDAVARHPEGGNVVLLEGIAGVSAPQQRLDGFKDQVVANPKFKIVASQATNNNRHQVSNVIQNILQSNPDADIVWVIGAEMGQGAVQAIWQSDTTCRIAVHDLDASSGDIAAIRAGIPVGPVAQYPELQAERATNATLDAMVGKNLPTYTVIKVEPITATNVDILEQQFVERPRGVFGSSVGGQEPSRLPGMSGKEPTAVKRPTLVDLMEASGFSVALVSIMMRGTPGASAEIRRWVKEVANRVGHQPNWLA